MLRHEHFDIESQLCTHFACGLDLGFQRNRILRAIVLLLEKALQRDKPMRIWSGWKGDRYGADWLRYSHYVIFEDAAHNGDGTGNGFRSGG